MLLQPRPKSVKAAAPIIQVKGPPKGPGKGKHELVKGKGKGKQKGPRVEWVTEINHGGQKKQLGMRYQTGSCQLGDSCRFHHACAYPKDGKACGGSHSAKDHRDTPHSPSVAATVSPTLQDDNLLHTVSSAADESTLRIPDEVPHISSHLSSAVEISPSNPEITSISPAFTAVPAAMPATGPSKSLMQHVAARHSTRIFLDICCGSHRPLSQAVLSMGADVLSIDKLFNLQHNLLDGDFMETLLRICASGVVGYTAASPSCNEYSRLKLKPGGPQALRSPQHLDGLPGITPEVLLKVQDSHTMLSNCVQALMVTYSSGGDGHLEQPTTAMSWSEQCVQQWLLTASCHCINLPACLYGADWQKSWMMASSLEALTSLSGVCEHGSKAHQSITGIRDSSGGFVGRTTAEYPPLLAESFAKVIFPFLSHSNRDLNVTDSLRILPIKQLQDAPFARQDGGGMPSMADWSSPLVGVEDIFRSIRQEVFQSLMDTGDFRILQKAFHEKQSDPPFPAHMVQKFQSMLQEFLLKHDKSPNWSIPHDQPMHWYILQSLSEIVMDPDVHLFDHLVAGVPTRFQQDIPLSNCFPILTDPVDNSHIHLSVHQTNWKSAEDNIDIARDLVQAEVDAGWVEQFHGTIGDAQSKWPLGVSVGKLGIPLSEHRPPRLVVDSSVCGLNSRCAIPEKGTLPSIKGVQRCFPLRQNTRQLSCLSLDVKSAHKRV